LELERSPKARILKCSARKHKRRRKRERERLNPLFISWFVSYEERV